MNRTLVIWFTVIFIAVFSVAFASAQSSATPPNSGSTSSGSPGAAPSGSDASIFNAQAFDNTVKKSQAQEKKDALSYMVGGSFLADLSAGTSTAFDGYSASGGFSGKAFAKVTVPRYGQLYLSYDLQHTLLQGAGGSTSATPVGSDLFTNNLALSEFFYDFDLAKKLFVRVGNQLVAWGPSNVWTPVDFINSERASSLQSIDLRRGKPGVKLFIPFTSWDVTAFTDFSNSIQNGAVTDLAKTTNIAIRTAVTVGGFELGLSTYLGESIQNRYGFDFSGNLLGNAVYSELALLFPYDSYSWSYASSVGFSRSVGELKRWSLRGEFFYNSKGTDATSDYPSMVAANTFVPLYVGKVYGYASVSKSQFLASFLDLTLSGIGNFSDGSYQAKVSSKFSIPNIVPFTLSVSYNGGGANKEFTYFSGNNSLGLDLQVLAQF